VLNIRSTSDRANVVITDVSGAKTFKGKTPIDVFIGNLTVGAMWAAQ
jgi:hypothetical protein